MVSGSVKIVPKQMTTPIGIHRLVWAKIIGSTPNAVVAEVKNTGRIRRKPAWKAASRTERCFVRRSSSAYSYMIMAFRTMMPIKLTIPNTTVIDISIWNILSPTNAPKTQRIELDNAKSANDTFPKW